MAAADNPAHLQAASGRLVPEPEPELEPRGPATHTRMFYSAAGAARTLIYLREGRWEQTRPSLSRLCL